MKTIVRAAIVLIIGGLAAILFVYTRHGFPTCNCPTTYREAVQTIQTTSSAQYHFGIQGIKDPNPLRPRRLKDTNRCKYGCNLSDLLMSPVTDDDPKNPLIANPDLEISWILWKLPCGKHWVSTATRGVESRYFSSRNCVIIDIIHNLDE